MTQRLSSSRFASRHGPAATIGPCVLRPITVPPSAVGPLVRSLAGLLTLDQGSWSRFGAITASSLGTALWFPIALWGQVETTLDASATCAECRIVPETLLEISSEDEEAGPLSAIWTVAEDSQGRYWASFAGGGLVRVYGRTGKPVRGVGSLGEGPGEYRAVLAAVPVGDSMALFDPALGRMTIVGPELEYVRSIRVPGQVLRGTLMEWPRMALNALIPGPNEIGFPFHILNLQTGEIERSFGGRDGGDYTPLDRNLMVGHVLWDSGRKEIWTASRTRFLVQRWSPDGQLLQAFSGLESVFPDGTRGQYGTPSRAPDPLLTAFALGRDGFLRVGLHLPAEDWERAWEGVRYEPGPHPRPNGQPRVDLLYSTVAFVLDPEQGAIMARVKVDADGLASSNVPNAFVALDGMGGVFPSLLLIRLPMVLSEAHGPPGSVEASEYRVVKSAR